MDFDIERMEEAMAGPFYTVPSNMTHAEIMMWLDDCCEGRIQPDSEVNND